MKVRADEARRTKGMNPMFKHVVLAGAAALTLAACASPAVKDAALTAPRRTPTTPVRHAPRLPEPGVWQLIADPTADHRSND